MNNGIMDINRRTAYEVLLEIEEKEAFSNISLNRYMERNAPDSPKFVRELVYGVLENKIYIDFLISHYLKRGVRPLRVRESTLLRMGMYQLEFMDSVSNYGTVNEMVNLAKKYCKGREGFINAVLRSHLRRKNPIELPDRGKDETIYLATKYSYAPWIVELILEEYGPQAEGILMAGNRRADLVLRVNALKISAPLLMMRLEEKGFQASASLLVSEGIKVKGEGVLSDTMYEEGLFSVQDEASMIAVKTLDPKPGERLIDMCAAPGGKTFFSAELMGNTGKIIAGDFYDKKLERMTEEARRLGISIVETKAWDGTRILKEYEEFADRVLADVPCSGLGVVRRKPEIKYKEFSREMEELPKKQLAILKTASRYCRTGGTVVYSTCTIIQRENQKVVEEFLRENANFEMIEEHKLLPHQQGTDGFYIAKMRKNASEKGKL
ncbi:MAG: 16S rRNA (cytosine(967)-C(5))-methyltransferase RsmB [Anaerovoracaceae bacterium]|jgi:16S rRNA (cytosine967-C5)-methyltransferase